MPRKPGLTIALTLLGCSLAAQAAVAAPKERPPERARDLAYGSALYEYYQGNAFGALTELAVAEKRGGVKGHGDHPELLRGGMMLSYGMTRTAKAVFQTLLKEKLSPATRNLAWFYLAKVFYLERDFPSASDSIRRVEMEQLSKVRPELYEELVYLQGQIALNSRDEATYADALERLPEESVWRPYLEYNYALLPATAGVLAETLARMRSLTVSGDIPLAESERQALLDRIYLTEASFQLDAGENRAAMGAFQKVRLDGPLSDQALFGYALATANEKEFGLSLQALLTLSDRPLFNSWIQQVPYALGYLYERLDSSEQALNAYSKATGQYIQLRSDLDGMIQNLDEAAILRSLKLDGPDARSVELGTDSLGVDSYGRLKVLPADFNLAQRIASEPFQIGLRDLHELYKIRGFFTDWNNRLETAELMLDTRERQLDKKIAEAKVRLEEQDRADWLGQLAEYKQAVNEAVETEQSSYFLNQEQLDFQDQIKSFRRKVERLNDDALQKEYAEKLRRIEGYFTWWTADSLGVNRWAVQKELNQLSAAVDTLQSKRASIGGLLASSDHNEALKLRIEGARTQVAELSDSLNEQISSAQSTLINLVMKDLQRQRKEVVSYLVASQEAKARLIDDKFRAQQAGDGS